MARRKIKKEIRLKNFGSVIGLVFERGGAAEMLMSFPEIALLIDAWFEYESAKTKPNQRTLLLSACSRTRRTILTPGS